MAAMAGGGDDVDPGSDAEQGVLEDLPQSEGLRQARLRALRMEPYVM